MLGGSLLASPHCTAPQWVTEVFPADPPPPRCDTATGHKPSTPQLGAEGLLCTLRIGGKNQGRLQGMATPHLGARSTEGTAVLLCHRQHTEPYWQPDPKQFQYAEHHRATLTQANISQQRAGGSRWAIGVPPTAGTAGDSSSRHHSAQRGAQLHVHLSLSMRSQGGASLGRMLRCHCCALASTAPWRRVWLSHAKNEPNAPKTKQPFSPQPSLPTFSPGLTGELVQQPAEPSHAPAPSS